MNRGVRGRLIEHCKYLIRDRKLKGYDANEIYEQTKQLKEESDVSEYHDSTIDMSEEV